MKTNHVYKKISVCILAAIMMMTALFASDVPVSAASLTGTYIKTTVTATAPKAIAIKWDKISGVKGYRIYKRQGTSGTWRRAATVSSSKTTYTVKQLTPNTTYQFCVRAYKKENGKKVWSKYTAATGYTALQNVTATASVVSSAQVKVKWNRVAGATGYGIWRKVNGGSWEPVKKVGKKISSYKDKSVSASTTYQYCVRAYTKSGKTKYWSKLIAGNSVTTPSAAKMTSAQKNVLVKILYAVETGGQVYGKQDYTDVTLQFTNSSTEYAITLGAGQWYGSEAKTLLLKIKSTYPTLFKKLDTKGLIAKDLTSTSWSSYKLYPDLKDTTKKKKTDTIKYWSIKNIISSAEGIKCQDALMIQQIESAETYIRSHYGVTDPKAVAECINISHQGGYGALTRVLKKTAKPYSLQTIYAALQSDTGQQVGAYRSRQKCVYTWLNKYF